MSGRNWILALALATGVSLVMTSPAGAQQFSADLERWREAGDAPALEWHINVAKNKIRMERTVDGGVQIVLVDKTARSVIALRPDKKWVSPIGEPGIIAFVMFLAPPNPGDACLQWQQLAGQDGAPADIGCRKIGPDAIKGRNVLKYEVNPPGAPRTTHWVDPKLGFIVKSESSNGAGLVLSHIREGKQAADLFEVPPGYHRPERPDVKPPG
ncbi:MAG TPA: hypothetical protein VET85_10190 [Stellaceae bacterium]|nr:hypothetical protein [Stellaceae bacterium]